jgi:hypothetical protein
MHDSLYKDWVFARNALRKIVREWNFSLSAAEFRAVMFVYDRTISWGKEWETITTEQMVSGVWNEENTKFHACPIDSNKNRARKMLNSLVERGLIYKRSSGKSSEYSLNLDDMKVPKRLQNTDNKGDESVPFRGTNLSPLRGTKVSPKEYRTKRRGLTTEEEERESAIPAGLRKEDTPLSEALYATEKVKARSRQVREENKKKKGVFVRRAKDGFVPFRNALQNVWLDFCRKYFSHVQTAAVSYLSANILHQYATAWTNARSSGEFMDFLEWVFQNWSSLGAGVFSWMKDFPLSPSIRIVSNRKLRGYIEEAYQEKEMWDAWRKMDELDRKVFHLTTKRGMDHEKAVEIAKKEIGYVDQLKEINEAKKMVDMMARRAKQAIEVERASLARHKKAVGPLVQVDGDFGRWED